MITVELQGQEALVGKMRLLPDLFRQKLNAALKVEALNLVTFIKEGELSGQVLKVGVGTKDPGELRDSIFDENTRNDTGGVTYKVASGGNIPYAAIHEYGGTIHHPGSNKFQAFEVGGSMVFTNKTAPHDITMPERSYMRAGLAHQKDEIVAAIQGSLKEAWLT